MAAQMMDATQLGQWLSNWIGNLTPDEQRQVQSAWERLTPAQQNMVVQNSVYGGPVEYQSQAMGIIDQASQGPKQAAPEPQTPGVPKPATASKGPTAAAGIETQVVNPQTGVSSETTLGGGSVPKLGSAAANALIQQYMTSPSWQGVQGGTAQDTASALGIDYGSANQQYQQYVQQFEAGQARITGAARGQFQGQQAQPMSETAFIQQLASSQWGIWGPVIGMIAYAWQEQNGTPLPPALAQQIRQRLYQMNTKGQPGYDPNGSDQLQAQVLNILQGIQSGASTAAGGQPTALNLQTEVNTFLTELSTFAPSIYSGGSTATSASLSDASPQSIIGQYIAANPSVTGEAAAEQGAAKKAAIDFMTNYGIPSTASNLAYLSNSQNLTNMGNYVSWMQSVGMPITAGTLQTLMTMPFSDPGGSTAPASGSGGAFLLAQPVPGANMNYGQYAAVSANMSTLWQQNFDATPTTAQLQWGVGKTPTQIQDFVDNSPSAVPGVTVGQYNDYLSFVNSLDTSGATTHAFSGQVDDSLINELHQHVTAQATGSAHPGPMT